MNNIYIIEQGHYKWYQSRSLTLVWGSVPFCPVRDVCPFGPRHCVCIGGRKQALKLVLTQQSRFIVYNIALTTISYEKKMHSSILLGTKASMAGRKNPLCLKP